MGFSLVVASGGYPLVAMRGLLVAMASACNGSSCGSRALEHRLLGLSGPKACGVLIRGPGTEPRSPVLVGTFPATEPPGKSPNGDSSNPSRFLLLVGGHVNFEITC